MDHCNLFTLCEDVLIEIIKFLRKPDMEALSLTCKAGFEVTRNYFETKTQFKISERMNLIQISEILHLKRDYKEKVLFIEKLNDIVIEQLKCFPINIKTLIFYSKIKELRKSDILSEILKIKTKIKSIENVFVKLNLILKSSEDILKLENDGFLTEQIASVGIMFDPKFDKEFYKSVSQKFKNLKELDIYTNFNVSENSFQNFPDIGKIFKIKKIKSLQIYIL